MESIVRKIRKAAIIVGCIAILISAVICVFNIIFAVYFMHSLAWNVYTMNCFFTIVNPVVTHLAAFLSQTSIALVLILIALWIDPTKVTPVFDNGKKNDCDKEDPQ